MDALFLKLLDMSLSAGWVVLGVLLLRLALQKAPKWLTCALWALVAVRLVCPISFESMLSLVPEFPSPQAATEETLPERIQAFSWDKSGKPGDRMTVPYPNDQGVNELYEVYPAGDGTIRQVSPQQDQPYWLSVFCRIWLAGMVVLLVYAAVSYLRLRKKVAASIALGNGTFLCDYISTPFILGIVKPRIYLPSEMDPKNAGYVLSHEQAHLKRKDHWWKPFGFCLLTVYWFHPLLWLAYVLLCRDIELACDERVVKDMALGDKKAYSEALLACSVPRRIIAACPLAFGEVGVKERVKKVLHYKKPAIRAVMVGIVLCVVAAVCLLTDPQAHTLEQLRKIRKHAVTSIDIYSTRAMLTVFPGDRLTQILEILEQTEYDPDSPVPGAASVSDIPGIGASYPYIQIDYGEKTDFLCFSGDLRSVYCWNSEEPAETYTIRNPDLLLRYMEDSVSLLNNNTITMAPFATAAEPWAWTQGVQEEALRLVRLYYNQDGANGKITCLSNADFRELLPLLHALPEDSITAGQFSGFDANDLIRGTGSSEAHGITLALEDFTNDLTAVLRTRGDEVELLLLNGRILWQPYMDSQQNVTIWKIRNRPLEDYMKKLSSDPPILSTWLGSRYDVEESNSVITAGNASIRTTCLTDWTYDFVQPTEETPSFGFRCRPSTETEGWLYFSYWPGDGYEMTDDMIIRESAYAECCTVTAWPSGISEDPYFDYREYLFAYKRNDYFPGDYVVINEGADNWYHKYRETISDLQALTTFQYGLPLGDELNARKYGDLTVDFSRLEASVMYPLVYFDWNTMVDATEAGPLNLTGAAEANGILTVLGEQGGKPYTFRFRKLAQGGLSFIP